MQVKILDLQRQYQKIREEVEAAVCRQMQSGQYIMGKAVTDFEKKYFEECRPIYYVDASFTN